MPSRNFKVTVEWMAKELIGGQSYGPSFLCCSWAEQYSVHGWKDVSDMATTAVLGTAAPQTHCRDGGLFKSPCLLLSSDTFPWPLSIAQRPHLSIRGLQAWRRFYKTPWPSFLSLAPASHPLILLAARMALIQFFSLTFSIHSGSCTMCLPSSSGDTIHVTQTLNPVHPPPCIWVWSWALNLCIKSPAYWSPHSLTLCSTISSHYQTCW